MMVKVRYWKEKYLIFPAISAESRSYPHVTCTTCLVKDTNGGNSQVRTFVAFVQIQADIEYRYSRTQVTSVMINPSATVSDEVNFSVYLPNTAFISKFSM